MHTNMSGTIDTGSSSSELSTQIASVNSDIISVRKDIATLALQIAVDTNRAAYNLKDSFIDQFEDDTGIASETNADRNATNEYVSSAQSTAYRYLKFQYTNPNGSGYPKIY